MEGRYSDTGAANSAETRPARLPRINLRPLLFSAVGLCFGIFFYFRIRFGGLLPSDFLFLAVFLPLALPPFSWKRILTVVLCTCVFLLAGMGLAHLYTERYERGMETGEYTVTGTVSSFAVRDGRTEAELTELTFDGEKVKGKLTVTLSGDDVLPGDIVTFTASVSRVSLPAGEGDSYHFVNNIRYTAAPSEYEEVGTSANPFLWLNARVYATLQAGMGGEEANVAYALLTGNSRMVDTNFLQSARNGGFAHIFAVSGLHIGILYAALYFAFRPAAGRYSVFPAIVFCLLYSAVCGFTVSSLRAVVMCAAAGIKGFLGRKYDFISGISLAAIVILLLFPAQWLAAGFRLSFGACVGLALFSGSFSRGMKRTRFPGFLARYLSAGLSVQIFTFPILMEQFGYFSVWGIALNLVLVPLLPVLFLTLFVCTAFSLLIAPAAAFFLQFPAALLALLLLAVSVLDVSFVLTGFSLGAGAVVFLVACTLLSERVRMGAFSRISCAVLAVVLFSVCLYTENAVPVGCKVITYAEGAVFFRTRTETVLVIGEEISLRSCETLLSHTYGGTLSSVVVLAEDEQSAVNVAAFLPAEKIYAKDEVETGLREREVVFGESFAVGSLVFRYTARTRLLLSAEGLLVDVNFGEKGEIGADLSLEKGSGDLKYLLKRGIIKAL